MLTILNAYENTYTNALTQVNNAIALGDIPPAQRQDLMKEAYDSAYGFVDSVINIHKYTHNQDLISEIQAEYLLKAMDLHDLIFEHFYSHTKDIWQVNPQIAVTIES